MLLLTSLICSQLDRKRLVPKLQGISVQSQALQLQEGSAACGMSAEDLAMLQISGDACIMHKLHCGFGWSRADCDANSLILVFNLCLFVIEPDSSDSNWLPTNACHAQGDCQCQASCRAVRDDMVFPPGLKAA